MKNRGPLGLPELGSSSTTHIPWPTHTVIGPERDTRFPANSVNTDTSNLLPTCTSTKLVITLISKPTVPFKRVCLTSFTLERLESYLMSPNALWGSSLRRKFVRRYMEKRVNVRIEHVSPSQCRKDLLERIKYNAVARAHAKASGEKVQLKRFPGQPRRGPFCLYSWQCPHHRYPHSV